MEAATLQVVLDGDGTGAAVQVEAAALQVMPDAGVEAVVQVEAAALQVDLAGAGVGAAAQVEAAALLRFDEVTVAPKMLGEIWLQEPGVASLLKPNLCSACQEAGGRGYLGLTPMWLH